MNYIIIESQTNGGVTSVLVQTASTENEAYSKYHSVLASGAISAVEKHSCTLLLETGSHICHECFTHEVKATASEESEVE